MLRAGAINASQLAQLFQNLGNPLPYDRLTKIMCDYDVERKGAPMRSLHDSGAPPGHTFSFTCCYIRLLPFSSDVCSRITPSCVLTL